MPNAPTKRTHLWNKKGNDRLMEPKNDISSAMEDHQPSLSEPLMKQVFSQGNLDRLAFGPAGIGWGLCRSRLDVVYWSFQPVLYAAFVAIVATPVNNWQEARECMWITLTCVLSQMLLWSARAFRIHQKQQQEGELSLGRCFLHTLLESAFVLVAMFSMTTVDMLTRKIVVDDKNPTWKDFGFYYAVVAVTHLGIYLTVSQAWAGALRLQSLQMPRLRSMIAMLVHCMCFVQLAVALFQLLGWSFRLQLSSVFLTPLNYLLFMFSLYANLVENLSVSVTPAARVVYDTV